MPDRDKTEAGDEIGDVNVEEIAAIIARFCPHCSPEEIMRLVQDIVSMRGEPGRTE